MKEKGLRGVELLQLFSIHPLTPTHPQHNSTEYWGINHDAPDAAPAHSASAFARAADRRRATLGGNVGQTIAAAAATDTIAPVLARMVGRRVHRLYIVDGEGTPLGLVTLTDVLRAAVDAAK